MTHSKGKTAVDKIRALILAEVLRNNYLEELLKNGKSAEDKGEDSNHRSSTK
jgi:hypothetical protein